MKKAYKTIGIIVLVLALGFWQLNKAPFYLDVNSKIPAKVYKDGVITNDTNFFIYGQKTNYLFHDDDKFVGKFMVMPYEITYGGVAIITRMFDSNIHELHYVQVEPLAMQELHTPLLMDDYMNKFALMATDGSVIATSDEMYEVFIKHVKADEGGTTIEHIDEIPKIDWQESLKER